MIYKNIPQDLVRYCIIIFINQNLKYIEKYILSLYILFSFKEIIIIKFIKSNINIIKNGNSIYR